MNNTPLAPEERQLWNDGYQKGHDRGYQAASADMEAQIVELKAEIKRLTEPEETIARSLKLSAVFDGMKQQTAALQSDLDARDKEIERLKGLLEYEVKETANHFWNSPDSAWQSYCAEHNIQP